MTDENHDNPHEADLLNAITLSTAEKKEYMATAGKSKPSDEKTASREDVIEALKTVCDPEIMINIWDMGLVYDIRIADNGNIDIDMTLTAPGCPVAGICRSRRRMLSRWLRGQVSSRSKLSGNRHGRWNA